MNSKAVFIGLGGAGVYSTGYLKAKLLFDGYNGDSEVLGSDCQFVFIDTDDDAVNTINREYGSRFPRGGDLVSARERVNLGSVNPYATYWAAEGVDEVLRNDSQKYFLSWIDKNGAREFRDQPLQNGAGANRQQGRVAIWSGFDQIRNRISTALNVLQDINSAQDFQNAYPVFYILSGTCGGTGSSAFLDVAYMLDQEFKSKYPLFGAPVTRAILFMPQWYIERHITSGAAELTVENYYCNAYAFFDELRALLKDRWIEDDGTKFGNIPAIRIADYEGLDSGKRKWQILNFAFCMDSRTEGGFTTNDEEMYRNAAELLYHWHMGSAQGTVVSMIDNEVTVFPNTPPTESVPAFFTIGYRALRFPEELMRDYFDRRFLYELFEYGILGKKYADALPDENVRMEELNNTFRRAISRYLFPEAQEDGIPNLYRDRNEIIESYISSLTLTRFNKEGKNEKDPGKIGTSFLLDGLIGDAKSAINSIKLEMERGFESPELDTGRERLLRYIQRGYRVQPDEAPAGSLETDVENVILCYGLNYAQDFVRRLDVRCEERVNSPSIPDDLTDVKTQRQRRIKELEAEIDSAKQRCISQRRGRDKINALNELYNKLCEYIRLSSEIEIIGQQIQVLNALSLGESGIVDQYKRRLGDLIDRIQERLESRERQETGLLDLYMVDLPKLFLKTKEDVTTTYLPDVADFVRNSQWRTDHLFARLYSEIVKQRKLAGGGEEPLRYGQDYGRHIDKDGLHRILWDILTGSQYTGMERGYEEYGYTNFFRRFFGQERTLEASQLGSLTETFATNYIHAAIGRSQNISNELNRRLIERFNALETDDRKLVVEEFDDNGTQTFCPMDRSTGDRPTAYRIYAGDDEELAARLGYSRADSTHQFVREGTPNRFLKIKVLTRHKIELYPYYHSYESRYNQVKQKREAIGSIFAPHIHSIFNRHGAENGLKIACQKTTDMYPIDDFTLLLLYREMLEAAFNDEKGKRLVQDIIYMDDRLRGEQKTCYSPLVVESAKGLGGVSHNIAYVCNLAERHGDKLVLRQGNYIAVSPEVRDHKAIYDGIARGDYPSFLNILSEFDQHFQQNCTASWMSVLNLAINSLNTKIETGVKRPGELGRFYTELNNSLVKVSGRLREVIEKSGAAPRPEGEVTEEIEPIEI